MKWLSNFLDTSVGRKQLMALTGLMLSGFLVAHLSGNFLLLVDDGGVLFNKYAAWIISQPWLVPAEIGLLAVFLFHIYLAFVVTAQNKRARKTPYYHEDASGASMASRSMILSGVLILVFVIIHLINFKFADHSGEDGLYGVVMATFVDPLSSSFYIICMLIMGMHLVHGIQSTFQTFGLSHPKHTPHLQKLLVGLAVAITAGFAFIPFYFLLTKGGA